jgi:penicillin amidase
MFLALQDARGRHESWLGLMEERLPAPLVAFLRPRDSGEWEAPLDDSRTPAPPIPGPNVVDLRRTPEAVAPVPPPSATEQETRADVLAGTGALAGSNNWAVDAAHTADGRAWLASDMHLILRVPNVWYRMKIVWQAGGGERHAVGA